MLRQGDPLSPFLFLFLIVAEDMNCLFDVFVRVSNLKGFLVRASNFRVLHLKFAYDTMIMEENS